MVCITATLFVLVISGVGGKDNQSGQEQCFEPPVPYLTKVVCMCCQLHRPVRTGCTKSDIDVVMKDENSCMRRIIFFFGKKVKHNLRVTEDRISPEELFRVGKIIYKCLYMCTT